MPRRSSRKRTRRPRPLPRARRRRTPSRRGHRRCPNWWGGGGGGSRSAGGNYLHFGVREFGMAGITNGMSLHGGLIPYAATFLVFSDYARNALRVAALMRTRAIYVFTHDSIGLGEDGPTHQPVEHAAALRI